MVLREKVSLGELDFVVTTIARRLVMTSVFKWPEKWKLHETF
jgi:hypothetical protein